VVRRFRAGFGGKKKREGILLILCRMDPNHHRKVLRELGKVGENMRGPLAPVSDRDWLEAAHRFLRDSEEDESLLCGGGDAAYAVKLAQRYWEKLNKEFACVDMSRLPALGLRWRTEDEVIRGKGQFFCAVLSCESIYGLHSYEVPFSYVEASEKKMALVKLRCCADCASKAFTK